MAPYIDKLASQGASCPELTDNCRFVAVAKSTPKSAMSQWQCKVSYYNQVLTSLWRHYGVKLSFIFTFSLIWSCFTSTCVDDDPKASKESFSPAQTFWLTAFRVVSLFIVNFTLPGLISLLLYTAPREGNQNIAEGSSHHEPLKVILRISTRGDYPKLIRDNIEFHENLFKTYWRHDLDEIEIHIVTATPLKLDRPRKNGCLHRCEVKEYFIPSSYSTPNNSLYKARNNTFGLARCVEEANEKGAAMDRIWVIAVDEDVFLTPCWLKEFDSAVLDSKVYGQYKFVNSPSRPVFVDGADGMESKSWLPPIVPFFGETFRFAMDISRVWWQAKLFGRSAVGVRGSCYAIRLDVEERIGYDCGGPYLSIGDDTTFLHRLMLTPDVRMYFLDAWFLEGAPYSAFEFMKQRARWVRNHMYFLIFSDIPPLKKLRLASFLAAWTIIMPAGMITMLTGYVLFFANHRLIDFFPAGPAWPIADFICCISTACVIYWYIYGCALLLPWYLAVPVSLTFSTYIPVLPLHAIGALAAVWGLLHAAYELIRGSADFGMTEKKFN